MQTKIQRFLVSIGLKDIDRFDMTMPFAVMNPYVKDQVDMVIEKDTPWDFALLDEFILALGKIRYKYTLRLSYAEEPTEEDVAALFFNWYFSHFHDTPTFSVEKKEEGVLVFTYESEEEKDKNHRPLMDFKDLLQLINYPFTFVEEIHAAPAPEEVKEEPAPEPEPEPEKIAEESAEPASLSDEQQALEDVLNADLSVEEIAEKDAEEESIVEEAASEPVEESEPEILAPQVSENVSEPEEEDESEEAEEECAEKEEDEPLSIEEEGARYRAAGEERLIREYEANAEIIREQKNRERVWSKGNYKEVHRIDDLYSIPQGNVDFVGEVFQAKFNISSKTGKGSNSFSMGDESNAINLKVFETATYDKDFLEQILPKKHYRIRGCIDTDRYSGQRMVIVHFMNEIPAKEFRKDEEEKKRVELHLHTNMSSMDGIQPFADFYLAAQAMGMTAIGLCDHGVVQSFPAAQTIREEQKKKHPELDPLKILYGCELYMFDPQLSVVLNPAPTPLRHARFCVFDTETTGLSAHFDSLIEFGAVVVEDGRVLHQYGSLINPQIDLTEAKEALAINKIEESDLATAPTLDQVLPKIRECLEGSILVAHNATFDVGFLNRVFLEHGLPPIDNPVIDTLALSRYLFPNANAHNEGALLKQLGLDVYQSDSAHRALYDAQALNEGWQAILFQLESMKKGITHEDLSHFQVPNPDQMDKGDENNPNDPTNRAYKKAVEDYSIYCRHLREHHITAYAKNKQGISALFRLVSASHTKFMARVPKTPKYLIEQERENLVLGSGCFNGEIFDLAMTRGEEELVEAMKFYDFIEIQPLENYSFLWNMGRVPSKDRLIKILRFIVDCARKAGRPIVATGDAHYVDPEDKIYRDVFIVTPTIGQGRHPLYPPAREKMERFENPDQHLRTTKEMLDSFREWCSEEEAQEFVVKNSNLVASWMDDGIEIVSKDTFAPTANLPNSAEILRELCESNFHKNYDYLGEDKDPAVLEAIDKAWKRLQRELEGIIGHGYAVTYYIAHRLIQLAAQEKEHFIVGSRGSVGSSFAATMAEITEVNPLPSHYHCPHCHYLEFADPKVYRSGYDLPDRKCPKCGHPLEGDGQNIPFETFLGFNAEKVPDIDLNFEDESQHRAHDYCRTLLGANNVFRAGTIETVADKTAFGYVRGYFEKMGKDPSKIPSNYIAYLAFHCQGVKRTTGQHPGGITVVPADRSVYDFTPVQYPANDTSASWLTTHFDYHSLHDEILKLDILGHIDPMAMRYYRDLTGVAIESIPLNDPKVLSLFSSTKELKMHRNFLGHDTGAAALPEFGTNQGMQMLSVIRPKTFNDLVIIAGLAHGTNVWAGNQEELVKSGKSINEIIGCRDEIMTYLISMGIDSSVAFKIMESVRKGKKLSAPQEAEMRAHNVPDFYIEACKKIKYLFPRGHAVAYVTMAVRVAYFKLYYPLEFYAVFFSIRSDDWDIKAMIDGEEAVIKKIQDWRERDQKRGAEGLSSKEKNQLKTLYVALEMLERGYHFEKIDIYRSDYKMFVVDHERKALIPPFCVIDGLGENAGKSLCEAREEVDERGRKKPFLSKQDLLRRATKLSSTHLKKLDELGALEGLGESDQMTLF